MTRAGSPPIDTLWYTRCPVPTATSVAVERGWLDEEFAPDGIRVISLRASTAPDVRESHFDHRQANSFRQGGNIPPIWTRARGGDVVVVALSWVDEYQAILALPESGIRTVKDLRGRRVGLPLRRHDQIDFFRAMCLRGVLTALALEGLAPRDVEWVDLPVEERYLGPEAADRSATLWSGGHRARRQRADAFALIRGEVDAIHTSGAAGAHLAAFLGAHEVIELGFHPDPAVRTGNETPETLTVSGSLARQRPDLVARWLARTLAAADWAASHRAEVASIVADEVGVPREWVDAGYSPDFHRRLAPDLREDWVAALADQAGFLLRRGFIQRNVDVAEWIDPGPLALARRAAP